MKMGICYLLIVFSALCLCNRSDYVSVNQKTSACGGFKSLSRQSAISYTQDSLDYCEDEKIRWNYDKTTGILSLVHTRQLVNCAAKLKMYVKSDGDQYIVETRDESDPELLADCMCYFDTYCELEDIFGTSINIIYKGNTCTVPLSDTRGAFELNVTASWPCF
ncbi:MAG: hypothetical protein GX640_17845 [Fibrobacter sp.]|nr:hypothetical protein [Fibrobacter sp.]